MASWESSFTSPTFRRGDSRSTEASSIASSWSFRDRFSERCAEALSTLEGGQPVRPELVPSPTSRFVQSPSSQPVSPLFATSVQDSPRHSHMLSTGHAASSAASARPNSPGGRSESSQARRTPRYPGRLLGLGSDCSTLPSMPSQSSLLERSRVQSPTGDAGLQLQSASSVDCFQQPEAPSMSQLRSSAALGHDAAPHWNIDEEYERWHVRSVPSQNRVIQPANLDELDVLREFQQSLRSKDMLILELEERLTNETCGKANTTYLSSRASKVGFLHWGFVAFQRAVVETRLRGHIWALEKSLSESEGRVDQLATDMEALLERYNNSERSRHALEESLSQLQAQAKPYQVSYSKASHSAASGVVQRTLSRLALNGQSQTIWSVLRFWRSHVLAARRMHACAARAIHLWRGDHNSERLIHSFAAWLRICSKIQPTAIPAQHPRRRLATFTPKTYDWGLSLSDELLHLALLQSFLVSILACWHLAAAASAASWRNRRRKWMTAVISSWRQECLSSRWHHETRHVVVNVSADLKNRSSQIADRCVRLGQARLLLTQALRAWLKECTEAKLSLLMQSALQEQSVRFQLSRNELLERHSQDQYTMMRHFSCERHSALLDHVFLAWRQQTTYSLSFACRVAPALARHHEHQFLFAVLKEWIRVYINAAWKGQSECVLSDVAEGLQHRGTWIADRLASVSMLRLVIADAFHSWVQVMRDCKWEFQIQRSSQRSSIVEERLRDQAAKNVLKFCRLAGIFEDSDRKGVKHVVFNGWLQRCHASKNVVNMSSWLGSCRIWNVLAAMVSQWASICRVDKWSAATEEAVELLAARLHQRWTRVAEKLFGSIYQKMLLLDVLAAWLVIIKGLQRRRRQDRAMARNLPWAGGNRDANMHIPLQLASASTLGGQAVAPGYGHARAALQVSGREFHHRSVLYVRKLFNVCHLSLILAQWCILCSRRRELVASDRELVACNRVASTHQICDKILRDSHAAVLIAQICAFWRQCVSESRQNLAVQIMVESNRISQLKTGRTLTESKYACDSRFVLVRFFSVWLRSVRTSRIRFTVYNAHVRRLTACKSRMLLVRTFAAWKRRGKISKIRSLSLGRNGTVKLRLLSVRTFLVWRRRGQTSKVRSLHLARHGAVKVRLLLARIFLVWRRTSKLLKITWLLNVTHLKRREASWQRFLSVRILWAWRRTNKTSKVKATLNTVHLTQRGMQEVRRVLARCLSVWIRMRIRMHHSRQLVNSLLQGSLRGTFIQWSKAAKATRSRGLTIAAITTNGKRLTLLHQVCAAWACWLRSASRSRWLTTAAIITSGKRLILLHQVCSVWACVLRDSRWQSTMQASSHRAQQRCLRTCEAADQCLVFCAWSEWAKVHMRARCVLATNLAVQEREHVHHTALSVERIHVRAAGQDALQLLTAFLTWKEVHAVSRYVAHCQKLTARVSQLELACVNKQRFTVKMLQCLHLGETVTAIFQIWVSHLLAAKFKIVRGLYLEASKVLNIGGRKCTLNEMMSLVVLQRRLHLTFHHWLNYTSANKFFQTWLGNCPVVRKSRLLLDVLNQWHFFARHAGLSKELSRAIGQADDAYNQLAEHKSKANEDDQKAATDLAATREFLQGMTAHRDKLSSEMADATSQMQLARHSHAESIAELEALAELGRAEVTAARSELEELASSQAFHKQTIEQLTQERDMALEQASQTKQELGNEIENERRKSIRAETLLEELKVPMQELGDELDNERSVRARAETLLDEMQAPMEALQQDLMEATERLAQEQDNSKELCDKLAIECAKRTQAEALLEEMKGRAVDLREFIQTKQEQDTQQFIHERDAALEEAARVKQDELNELLEKHRLKHEQAESLIEGLRTEADEERASTQAKHTQATGQLTKERDEALQHIYWMEKELASTQMQHVEAEASLKEHRLLADEERTSMQEAQQRVTERLTQERDSAQEQISQLEHELVSVRMSEQLVQEQRVEALRVELELERTSSQAAAAAAVAAAAAAAAEHGQAIEQLIRERDAALEQLSFVERQLQEHVDQEQARTRAHHQIHDMEQFIRERDAALEQVSQMERELKSRANDEQASIEATERLTRERDEALEQVVRMEKELNVQVNEERHVSAETSPSNPSDQKTPQPESSRSKPEVFLLTPIVSPDAAVSEEEQDVLDGQRLWERHRRSTPLFEGFVAPVVLQDAHEEMQPPMIVERAAEQAESPASSARSARARLSAGWHDVGSLPSEKASSLFPQDVPELEDHAPAADVVDSTVARRLAAAGFAPTDVQALHETTPSEMEDETQESESGTQFEERGPVTPSGEPPSRNVARRSNPLRRLQLRPEPDEDNGAHVNLQASISAPPRAADDAASTNRPKPRASLGGWRRQSQLPPMPGQQMEHQNGLDDTPNTTAPSLEFSATAHEVARNERRSSVAGWRRQSQATSNLTIANAESSALANQAALTELDNTGSAAPMAAPEALRSDAVVAPAAPTGRRSQTSFGSWRRQSLLATAEAPSDAASDATSDASLGTLSTQSRTKRRSTWRDKA